MSPPTPRIRVLVVDDSAFARKVVREVLSKHQAIEVVGIARDGLEALEKIAELQPDVVTLDLVMPNLDGIGVINGLVGQRFPRVVLVSSAAEESGMAITALQLGAVALVRKPTAHATDQLYEVSRGLIDAVLAAAEARPIRQIPVSLAPPAPIPAKRIANSTRILVVGASTGGPQALTRLITSLPAGFPIPVALVLHIPAGYTEAFAHRVNEASALEVEEAREGELLRPGVVVVARGGIHLKLERVDDGCRMLFDMSPTSKPHRPSVDVLFESAAKAFGSGVLGVVLTGMGDDGLLGSRAIIASGGRVITQTEASCVVYGMPRTVFEAGLSVSQVPIEHMADEVMRQL